VVIDRSSAWRDRPHAGPGGRFAVDRGSTLRLSITAWCASRRRRHPDEVSGWAGRSARVGGAADDARGDRGGREHRGTLALRGAGSSYGDASLNRD